MPITENSQPATRFRRANRGYAGRALDGILARPAVLTLLVAATMLAALAINPPQAMAQSLKADAAKILNARGCVACHYIPGVPEAKGTAGPSLKNLKNRPRLAGGILENTPDNLRDWLKNPKEIKPNTLMPDLGLEDSEIEILMRFFDTL